VRSALSDEKDDMISGMEGKRRLKKSLKRPMAGDVKVAFLGGGESGERGR
jgi:hypothetical protein